MKHVASDTLWWGRVLAAGGEWTRGLHRLDRGNGEEEEEGSMWNWSEGMSGQQISTLLMREKKEHKAQIILGSVTGVITAHEKANNELMRKTSSSTHLNHFQLF